MNAGGSKTDQVYDLEYQLHKEIRTYCNFLFRFKLSGNPVSSDIYRHIA